MKKYFNYAFAGAIALLGASVFTACSSESGMDSVENNTNPTYDPATQSVTTQFVLNVSSATGGITRQSANIVQKNQNFRGMQDAKLIGLATGKANTFLAPYNGGTTQTDWTTGSDIKAKVYDLGTLYGSTAVDNTGNNNRDESSHRIVELTLPVTTDAMLVYGRAIPDDDVAQNGKVTMPASYAKPENITFGLVPRLEDTEAYTQTCNFAALLFNRVLLSEVAAHAKPTTDTPRNGYTQKADLPALKWRTIGTMTQSQIDALTPLEQKLAIAYKVIRDTYKDAGSVHAGSAAAICNVIDDIYSIAKETADAKATSDAELNAQRLADAILIRIGYYFDRSSTPTKINYLGDVNSDEGKIKYYLVHNNVISAATFESGGIYAKVTDTYLQGYPHAFNIPDGVAQLTFEDFVEGTPITGGFKFKTLDNSSSLIEIGNTLNPSKYTYPAELLYFDNSLLRVNDNEVAAADYPNGYSKWDDNNGDTEGDGWAGWTTGPVASTTRSVAVKNNINYGVAMLSTKVTYDGTSGDTFEDNRPAAEGVKLAANDIKKLTLTGVLIGGQYKNVGWNFIRTGETDANKNFVIFDNQIANGAIPTPDDTPNYTLVFDNYSDNNGNVRVALEFTNNSDKDIYGLGGMIPKGGVFYLVGVLDLSTTNSQTIEWPTYYAIPPYTNAGGTNTEKKRVFIQDYLTTATFKIGATSLKNAYTTIPDLRASQISLGLSVDLNWREGLNFNVDF